MENSKFILQKGFLRFFLYICISSWPSQFNIILVPPLGTFHFLLISGSGVRTTTILSIRNFTEEPTEEKKFLATNLSMYPFLPQKWNRLRAPTKTLMKITQKSKTLWPQIFQSNTNLYNALLMIISIILLFN